MIIEWKEGATAITYFYSHIYTIISCFIISKLMYGSIRKIIDQETRINEIITALIIISTAIATIVAMAF